jgi:hypothetical protein
MKTEARIPKSERSPNSELRNEHLHARGIGFRNSDFIRASDFGFRILHVVTLAILLLASTAHAADTPSSAAPPPVKVANPVKEGELTTVTLSAQAEQRLGIVTATVEKKKVARTRFYGGDVVLPLATARADGGNPDARFTPNPPASSSEVLKLAEMQTQADGETQKAQVQLDAAKIAADRAERLLHAETGSQRALDDARAALQLARTALETAQARRALLGEAVGQTAALDRVWVRVPVYVGDMAALDSTKEARIGGVSDRPGSPTRPAKYAAGPPLANAGAATVDWFYEATNQDRALRLGQRVGVTLALRGEEESLVVPWAAVLHDIQGGQWVYENTAPQTFVRRRVQVARVAGADAVLASGPKPGAKVVTDGAAELFGTEFGAGK